MNRHTPTVVAAILAIVALGLYLTAKDPFGLGRAPAAFCAIAAALITFFWFVSGARLDPADSPFDTGALRTAVAASMTVLYVILVGTFAFWEPRLDEHGKQIPLADITSLLLTNFNNIVGVVIAFYFGASAYVEVKGRTQSGGSKNGGKGSPTQPTAAGDAPPAARP